MVAEAVVEVVGLAEKVGSKSPEEHSGQMAGDLPVVRAVVRIMRRVEGARVRVCAAAEKALVRGVDEVADRRPTRVGNPIHSLGALSLRPVVQVLQRLVVTPQR